MGPEHLAQSGVQQMRRRVVPFRILPTASGHPSGDGPEVKLAGEPTERTWHGKVAGVVPYDFRVPDLQRLRNAYWNPDSDVLFTEQVVGVGWSVNLPVAMRKLSATASQYATAIRSRTEG